MCGMWYEMTYLLVTYFFFMAESLWPIGDLCVSLEVIMFASRQAGGQAGGCAGAPDIAFFVICPSRSGPGYCFFFCNMFSRHGIHSVDFALLKLICVT